MTRCPCRVTVLLPFIWKLCNEPNFCLTSEHPGDQRHSKGLLRKSGMTVRSSAPHSTLLVAPGEQTQSWKVWSPQGLSCSRQRIRPEHSGSFSVSGEEGPLRVICGSDDGTLPSSLLKAVSGGGRAAWAARPGRWLPPRPSYREGSWTAHFLRGSFWIFSPGSGAPNCVPAPVQKAKMRLSRRARMLPGFLGVCFCVQNDLWRSLLSAVMVPKTEFGWFPVDGLHRQLSGKGVPLALTKVLLQRGSESQALWESFVKDAFCSFPGSLPIFSEIGVWRAGGKFVFL